MFVEELNNTREWMDFLKITARGTFYHTLKWREVLKRSFALSTLYLVIKSEDGKVIGVCPTTISTASHLKILNSLPHSDFGGPLIEKKYIRDASLSLQRYIKNLSRERDISFAEICFLKDGSEKFFKSLPCYTYDVGIMELDLRTKPSAFIWGKMFRYTTRRNIRLFKRDGFQVREASTKSDLRTFLTLYYQNMKHIGALAKPSTFFENVWNLLYPENFRILLVEKSKTLGGAAFFKYGETIYLTYFGMDREWLSHQRASRYSIQPFVCWNTIKWAEENGFRYICLGSTPAHPKSASEKRNYSLKVKFGGSFLPQEIIFIPFNSYARSVLLFGSKAIKTWITIRNILPRKLQNTIEAPMRKLGGFF